MHHRTSHARPSGRRAPSQRRQGLGRYLHRLGRGVALLGLTAWAVGSAASFLAADASLFQRFGSLGTAAAVLFFSDRLTQIELSRQRTVERLLHEFGVELQELKAGTDPRDMPRAGYVIDFLTEERRFDELRDSAGRWGMLNIALLTLATLQWGFGDRFFSAFLL